MFIILLEFSENKDDASLHMAAHNDWIKEGFDNGTFVLVGSIQPNKGGSILAHDISKEALDTFLLEDPFVAKDIVKPTILEVSPKRTVGSLSFLMENS